LSLPLQLAFPAKHIEQSFFEGSGVTNKFHKKTKKNVNFGGKILKRRNDATSPRRFSVTQFLTSKQVCYLFIAP